MRIVLIILLASTAALALTAMLVRPEAAFVAASPTRPSRPLLAAAALRPAAERALAMPPPTSFALPLMEKALPASRRAEPLEADLREAMDRIEPVMDSTRLDGPFSVPAFRIWPGTASLADVFGEHWRLASQDPNVQLRVPSYALAWHRSVPFSCDDYFKNRPHAANAPALSALTGADCEAMRRRASQRRDDAAPVPVVPAPLTLAAFAAPLPGARMSSRDFWVAQRERVEAMRDRLQRKWRAAGNDGGEIGLRE